MAGAGDRLGLAAATLSPCSGRWGSFAFTNYDDNVYVTANPRVRSGLTLRGLAWALRTGYAGNWHPLTWLSHMLDCQLFGLNAGAHHLVNVLFHVANTLLLFRVLRRMTGALWRSALVAALFALHPLHVESVAWVAERKDVLSALLLAADALGLRAVCADAGSQPSEVRDRSLVSCPAPAGLWQLLAGAGILRLRADEQADGGDAAAGAVAVGLLAAGPGCRLPV